MDFLVRVIDCYWCQDRVSCQCLHDTSRRCPLYKSAHTYQGLTYPLASKQVCSALLRCTSEATAADGDGAAPGVPPRALSEVVLEFFEAAVAPAAEDRPALRREVQDGARRVAALASQGAFTTIQVNMIAYCFQSN